MGYIETNKEIEKNFKAYFSELDWQRQDELLYKLNKIRGD
jgi:hypothetical protein